MIENDYRKLLILLFESDNFLKEITTFVAFNYPITTQEYILSVNCEKHLRKFQKNHLQFKHQNQMNVFCQ